MCLCTRICSSKRHKSGSMEEEVDSPGEYYHSPSPASSSRNWTEDMEGGERTWIELKVFSIFGCWVLRAVSEAKALQRLTFEYHCRRLVNAGISITVDGQYVRSLLSSVQLQKLGQLRCDQLVRIYYMHSHFWVLNKSSFPGFSSKTTRTPEGKVWKTDVSGFLSKTPPVLSWRH